MEKNPWAVDGKRPPIEMDNDGEWNDEEAKLYDNWERDNYDLPNDWQPNYNGETSEEKRDNQIKLQKLK